MEMSGELHAPGRFNPGERAAGSYWVGPRAGLNVLSRRKPFTSTGLTVGLRRTPTTVYAVIAQHMVGIIVSF